MHLLIRSDKTFLRSYRIKIPLIRSYTIKIPLIRSYTIKIPLISSYTIKIPLIRSYTIKIPLIRSYTIKIPLIRSYKIKIPLIRSYTIKIPLMRSYTIKIPDLFRLCPPPSTLCAPQLQSTCHYIVNHYVKILHVRLGGANKMRPLSWGGHKRKRSKIPLIRSYTIKISSFIKIPEVWYILHIEDNSEFLLSSSRKTTACNT